MQAIRLDFDPNSLSRIENLILVLEFIRGESLEINSYTKGVIPTPALDYIEQFKEEQELSQEDGLSTEVIQRLNEVWIEKKYTQNLYINELHTWLTTLDYDIHPEELEAKSIGDSTKAAIEQAQSTYELPITGKVTVVLEQYLLEAYITNSNGSTQEELLQVSDIERLREVVAPLSLNGEGTAVQHLQLALVWLGHKIYKSEYRAAFFGKQTRLSVIDYQKKHGLEAAGEVTTAMAAHMNKQLLVSKPTLFDENTYRVRGTIKNQNWQGIEGASVLVYEQLLRGTPVLLGEQTTDNEGAYTLIYTPPVDAGTGKTKTKFHLLVHLKDQEGTLLKELTFFNVLATTWANFTTGNLPYLGKSLYEEHLETLEAHLSGLKIEEIEESELNKDIEYLNASSGLGGNEIMLLTLAHRITQQWTAYNIHPSVIYAFFKQQLPQSLPSYLLPDEGSEWNTWINNLVTTQATAIALMPRPLQEVALQTAAKDNILPIEQYNQLTTVLDALAQARAHYAENAPLVGKDASLKDILANIEELPADEKAAIIDNFGNTPNFSSQFIQSLGDQGIIGENVTQKLQQEYLLFELGNQELEQTSNLKNAFNKEDYSTLVTQVSDFAKWSVEDWQIYISNAPVIPMGGAGGDQADGQEVESNNINTVEAEDLYSKAVSMAPTVAALSSLGRSGRGTLKNLTTIRTVVDENQWLNLIEIPLLQLEQDPEFELSQEALEELKIVQRVQKIATSPTTTTLLIDQGIQSAQKAFGVGVAGISNALQQGGMPATTADTTAAQIFSSAQQQVGAVLGLGTAIRLIGNSQLDTNVLPKLANIADLFGSTDTCACEHCRSVYSPAAYLTDLLQWLKKDKRDTLDTLLERRPDLEYILLNCKNANTPLPYIDLVNEILEYAIGKYHGELEMNTAWDGSYLKRNTTWTAAALRIQAEHQWTPVYEKFALLPNENAYKPVTSYSGFNLWQSQFHLYLGKLGIDTFELVQQLGNYNSTNKKIIAETAAYFSAPIHEVYDWAVSNYDYSTHSATTSNVEQFLKHHELTYEQLVELVQGAYINPDGTLEIAPLDGCSLSEKELVNLTTVHYNRIWRFLSLWKYTGWELRELDLALVHPAVGNGNLDTNVLEQLVKVHQLQQQLGTSLEACLTLFGTMNTNVWLTAENKQKEGLYQQTYLANHLEEGVKVDFEIDNFTLDLQAPTAAQLNYIAAAIGTNISTVQTILTFPTLENISQVGGTTVAQQSTLIGLSNLYAYSILANALAIDLEELVQISQFLYAGTTVNQDLTTFQEFLEGIKAWQAQGTAVATVEYLAKEEQAANFLSLKQIQEWNEDLSVLLQEGYDGLMEETKTDRLVLGKLFAQTAMFPDEEAIENFLDILEGKTTVSNGDLFALIQTYFDYISYANKMILVTNIQAGGNATSSINLIALTAIKQHLHRFLNRDIVYNFLSDKLNSSTEILAWGLNKQSATTIDALINVLIPIVNQPPLPLLDNPSGFVEIIQGYQYIHKLTLLSNTLGLDLATILTLEEYHALLNLIQPSNIPFNATTTAFTVEQWKTTWNWLQLCEQYNCAPKDWFAALETLSTSSTNDFEAYFAALEGLLGWEAALLSALQDHFNWLVTDYLAPSHYKQLIQQMAVIQQSQETPTVVLRWPDIFDVAPVGISYLEQQQLLAAQVQQSLQKAVAPEKWQQYQEQIQGQIRELKRATLVAYARNYAPNGASVLLSVNELYKYYLIDPGMSSCQYTSRIKQAISSVQLFVQRCLMGLEGQVSTQAASWIQWDWMQSYRVWEANRKVFLYPENWIEPALRDDKTELFKQFEDQLLQAEITSDNVEKSLQEYLVKLHHISNLEMKSICQGANSDTIHVLARTKENPADYYYRKLDKVAGTWTGWEKIEAAIKGEHPVLQFYSNRVHIFWLDILEKPQEQIMHYDTSPTRNFIDEGSDYGNATALSPNYKEIKLAWITLYTTGWSPQVLSKDTLIHPWPRPDYSLHLRPRPKEDDLLMDIYVSTSREFNSSHFYNQFENAYVPLTDEPYNENIRPWHSSSFVFDGFVKEIKVKPISGTYWYVGLQIQASSTTGTVQRQVPITNRGAIWIREVRNARAINYLPTRSATRVSSSLIKTNYGTFDFSNRGDIKMFQNLIDSTRNRTNQSFFLKSIKVRDVFYDTNVGENKFYIEEIWFFNSNTYYYTIQELNNFLQKGNANPPVSAIEPTELKAIPATRLLVPSTTPNIILKLTDSDSSEYIQYNFGETGRKIKKMPSYEVVQTPIAQIPNLHYQYNHLVPNSEGYNVSTQVNTANRVGIVPENPKALDWKVTVPMSGELTQEYRYKNMIYQDEFRAFYLDRENYIEGADQNMLSYIKTNIHALYHPLTRKYISKLGANGLESFYERGTQEMKGSVDLLDVYNHAFFNDGEDARGVEKTSFSPMNGYAIYNWELFFHIPLMIATELSKNQRFEEATKWFHFIFNPMGVPSDNDNTGSETVSKYWITKPFFEQTQQTYQDNLVQNLLRGTLSQETQNAINNWMNNPFNPHLVARTRPVAYQKAVVMKYIDNLIAWGDQLYRRETLESINQAALRYIVAAEILGNQPTIFVTKGVEDEDFATIKLSIDAFSNADLSVLLENAVMWTNKNSSSEVVEAPTIDLNNKYFCIPKNEKLASYWDLVGDRLFKIRHCMNIDGVVRQLPLFAPPIDPALLVQAQANGVDISSVLNNIGKAKNHYKYRALSRLAMQFCGEVKSLGQSLLSALQSKDAEGMALLQSSNTISLLNATVAIKQLQIQETEESIKSLELSKAAAEFRKQFYESRQFMNAQEISAERKTLESISLDQAGTVIDAIAGIISLIPEVVVNASLDPGILTQLIDGGKLANSLKIASSVIFRASGIVYKEASMAATKGSFKRRKEEWDMQTGLATRDIEQIDQQIATAQLRVAIAKKDLEVHQLQIDNAQSEQEYLQSKYTNQQLYSWMVGQISKTYYQAYQLAFDMAKEAEKSMRYELALPTAAPSMIKFGYWDNMKKGLLAGDKLMLAINKMEAMYVEKNSRDLELTKHISLHQLAPEQLIELRTKGSCTLDIQEWWFDMDYPGHYLRRIKALSVSIPCITGPNTTVACTLTMTKNSIRNKEDQEDHYYGVQSIATSSAQNDAGVFELNMNEERFLPFEGAGVVSQWKLSLPERASFDYQTITDVVLHMRYQAKDGGEPMATTAKTRVDDQLNAVSASQLPVVLLSLKTAFPTAWHRFLHPEVAGNPVNQHKLTVEVMNKHFPYFSSLFANREITAAEVGVLLKEPLDAGATPLSFPLATTINTTALTPLSIHIDDVENKLYGTVGWNTLSISADKSSLVSWELDFTDNTNPNQVEQVEDIFLLLKYKVS